MKVIQKKDGSVWFRHGKLQGNMLFPSIHFGENFWCSNPNLDPGGVPLRTGLSENRVPQNPLVYLVNYTMFAILIAVTGGCTAFSGTTRKQPQMFSTRSISCLWRSSKNHSANCHWPWQLEISLGREGLGGGLFCIGQVMGKWELLWC
jgi:hypothetical protein